MDYKEEKKMTINDMIKKFGYEKLDIVVNVAGFLLPIEDMKKWDGKIHLITSASALEDRKIEIHLEK